jgi:hypothetical protein
VSFNRWLQFISRAIARRTRRAAGRPPIDLTKSRYGVGFAVLLTMGSALLTKSSPTGWDLGSSPNSTTPNTAPVTAAPNAGNASCAPPPNTSAAFSTNAQAPNREPKHRPEVIAGLRRPSAGPCSLTFRYPPLRPAAAGSGASFGAAFSPIKPSEYWTLHLWRTISGTRAARSPTPDTSEAHRSWRCCRQSRSRLRACPRRRTRPGTRPCPLQCIHEARRIPGTCCTPR